MNLNGNTVRRGRNDTGTTDEATIYVEETEEDTTTTETKPP